MIRLEMLPASFGDCLLLSYGEEGRTHRVLVDAGLKGTYQKVLKPALATLGRPVPFDLVVVTHLDRDHICGMIPLVEQMPDVAEASDIWFNGRDHLTDDRLGTSDAEILGRLLDEKELAWNTAFEQRAVVIPNGAATAADLPRRRLPGCAVLTLLSPYREQLTALADAWDSDALGSWDAEPEPETAAGAATAEPDDVLGKRPALDAIDVDRVLALADEPFDEDDKAPNGSSIAFLFEYDGKRILFGADAHPTVLLRSLELLQPGDEPFHVDAFKLPHHGSMNNLSPDLLRKLDCPCFLVSTNGDSFGHPHPEAISRILTMSTPKQLCFNYDSAYTRLWTDARVRQHFGDYAVVIPDGNAPGCVLEL